MYVPEKRFSSSRKPQYGREEEMEFKLEHSLNELSEKISDDDLDPIININRKNYCK